jgi:hypothetical protein
MPVKARLLMVLVIDVVGDEMIEVSGPSHDEMVEALDFML